MFLKRWCKRPPRQERKSKVDESDDGSDDEPPAEVSTIDDLAGEKPLRRGQLIFRDWSSKLCLMCIQHMEPIISCHQLTNVKVEGLKQILDNILDIRVFDSKPHRCADPVLVTLSSHCRSVMTGKASCCSTLSLTMIQACLIGPTTQCCKIKARGTRWSLWSTTSLGRLQGLQF